MQKLTNKEEEIMHILWKLEKAFVKDVLAEIKLDKPHYNTLSTIIRNLEEKGYVAYNAYGKTHQYFPIVSKEDYKTKFIRGDGDPQEIVIKARNYITDETTYLKMLRN